MRILHVTDCYLPRLGGIEMHVHDLIRAQRAAGHDARVVTTTPRSSSAQDEPDDPWVTRVTSSAGVLSALLRRTAPDVVHAHVSVISPFAMSAARHACDLGVPVLVTVHSLWPNLPSLAPLAGLVLGRTGRRVLWSAVSSRAAEPLAAALGASAPHPLVLPNAVDTGFWRVEHRPTTVPTIISVMRLARRKRPLALARILREVREKLPDDRPLRAVIIGEGPRRGALQRYLDRHRMGDWVQLSGRLDRAGIRTLYATAAVYVAPATLESFGIAALEARCAGVPVVASSLGGVGEFVVPGVDGLLAATDAGLVAALVRLVTDADLSRGIAEHNRAVLPRFDWETACQASLAAYDEAAGLTVRPRRRAALA